MPTAYSAEHHQPLQVQPAPHRAVGDEGGDDQRVHRDARRAGHQRRHHDGGQPVAPAVDDAGGHDAGNGAGEAGQQRDEGAPVQPGAAHDAVHQERRPRHVAEILQQQDEQEQHQDLRQEHQHRADAADQPVAHEAAQQPVRQHARRPARRASRSPALIASIGGCAQVNTAWNIRNSTASRIASPATGCSSTASIRLVTVSGLAGRVTQAARCGRPRAAGRGCRPAPRGAQSSPAAAGGRGRDQRVEPFQQRLRCRRAAPPPTGTTGTPSSARQAVEVEAEAAVAGDVEHVQRQQHAAGRRGAVPAPAGRASRRLVASATQSRMSGRGSPAQPAEHHVAGDFLVGAAGAQRIGAGQVEQPHRPAGRA